MEYAVQKVHGTHVAATFQSNYITDSKIQIRDLHERWLAGAADSGERIEFSLWSTCVLCQPRLLLLGAQGLQSSQICMQKYPVLWDLHMID